MSRVPEWLKQAGLSQVRLGILRNAALSLSEVEERSWTDLEVRFTC